MSAPTLIDVIKRARAAARRLEEANTALDVATKEQAAAEVEVNASEALVKDFVFGLIDEEGDLSSILARNGISGDAP